MGVRFVSWWRKDPLGTFPWEAKLPQTSGVLDWAFLLSSKGKGGGRGTIKPVFTAWSLAWVWGFSVNLIKLFLEPTTSIPCCAYARNLLLKEFAARTQGAPITLCFWMASSSPSALCSPRAGRGMAWPSWNILGLEPRLCDFTLSLHCRFLFLQVCNGSMQENFYLPLFIWKISFSHVLSARESTVLLRFDGSVCSNTASSTLRRGRGTLGARLVYISADSLLSLFWIPLIAWQEKYREDTAIWLTVLGAGGGQGWMTGKGSAVWLPAKFQQETEYLASSNLWRKIKLQKPLVETLHTFSTIAMPDRKNLIYYLVYSYRIKGISFPTRNEEKNSLENKRQKPLKNPQMFCAIRVLEKFSLWCWWMGMCELCVWTSSPTRKVNFCTWPGEPLLFSQLFVPPSAGAQHGRRRWMWGGGSQLPWAHTIGWRRGLGCSCHQWARAIGQELLILVCIRNTCLTQREESLSLFHVCHQCVDGKRWSLI